MIAEKLSTKDLEQLTRYNRHGSVDEDGVFYKASDVYRMIELLNKKMEEAKEKM